MDSVTVIIPHFGADEQQERSLDICLSSLQATIPSSVRIIIASNGEKCTHHASDITIKEQGQGKAVNAAAGLTDSKWLFVTNDDMVYAPGWLEKLLATAKKYNFKHLSPNLVEPTRGAPPFLNQPFGGAGGDFNMQAWLEFAAKHVELKTEQGFNLPYLIDHNIWNRIGGYDVNYDPWGSNGDSDIQAKLILGGLETMRERNVIVYHFSQTSGTFEPRNHAYWEKNYAYFTKKWGFDRQPDSDKVWYSREIVDFGKCIFKPEYVGKLGETPKTFITYRGFNERTGYN